MLHIILGSVTAKPCKWYMYCCGVINVGISLVMGVIANGLRIELYYVDKISSIITGTCRPIYDALSTPEIRDNLSIILA